MYHIYYLLSRENVKKIWAYLVVNPIGQQFLHLVYQAFLMYCDLNIISGCSLVHLLNIFLALRMVDIVEWAKPMLLAIVWTFLPSLHLLMILSFISASVALLCFLVGDPQAELFASPFF